MSNQWEEGVSILGQTRTSANIEPAYADGVSGSVGFGQPSGGEGDATATLTGIQCSSGIGNVTVKADISIAVAGVSATSSYGTVTAVGAGSAVAVLTGVSCTSAYGNVQVIADVAISLVGVGATASQGIVTASVAGVAFTSKASGNWSSAGQTTWNQSGVPGINDTVTIQSGHTVTVDTNVTVGVTSGTVISLVIAGTSAASYGKLVINKGVTLTVRGATNVSYPALSVSRYGVFQPEPGSTFLVDCTSDDQTIVVNNGHTIFDGVTLGIPAANIFWNNQGENQAISNATHWQWDGDNNIYFLKLRNTALFDPGPISNASGTGIGCRGDSSFTIVSGTIWSNEVASIAELTNEGDYYINYVMGMIWYKTSINSNLTVTYNIKYCSWYSTRLNSITNYSSGCSLVVKNCIVNNWGTVNGTWFKAAFYGAYKYAPTLDADRAISFTDNTFNYCGMVLRLSSCTADVDNYIPITGNTFSHCRWTGSGEGLFYVSTGFLDISRNVFNSLSNLFGSAGAAGDCPGMKVNDNTGTIHMGEGGLLPRGSQLGTTASQACRNTFLAYGGNFYGQTTTIRYGGSSGQPNLYEDNVVDLGGSFCNYENYMIIRRSRFPRCYFTGLAGPAYVTCYLHDFVFENNIISDGKKKTTPGTYTGHSGDTGGGWIPGAGQQQAWVDNCIIRNNTIDGCSHGIMFNYIEANQCNLVTRTKIINNILSNNRANLYRPADSGYSYLTKMALSQLDYNVDYNPLVTATNIRQSTFMKGGVNYNTGTKNVAGIYLHSPSSGYTLPDATNRSLVLTASGTEGTDKALNIAWGGGTAQNLVLYQGTASAGSPTTLTDSGKNWTTNELRCQQVIIVSGTGAGQYGMIISNTNNQITIIANNDDSEWATAPSTDSIYLIINSEVTLLDSGGVNSVHAGVYSPELVLTSQTDTDITIDTHAQTANPNFVSSTDFHITAGSSALNNGTATDAASEDLEKYSRPIGSAHDIGCYEYWVLAQTSYRFRADDGNEVAASWIEPQLVNTLAAAGEHIRVRILIDSRANKSSQFQLEFKKSTDSVYQKVQ